MKFFFFWKKNTRETEALHFASHHRHGETTTTASVTAAEKDREQHRDKNDVGEEFGKE